jgi:hypothetical protein
MIPMTPTHIIKRFEALHSQRQVVQQQWDVIEKLVAPYRGRFFKTTTSESAVEWSRRDIFDSTAVMAHQLLASSLHGGLTNPAVKWFDLQWREQNLRDDYSAQTWLEACGKKVYDALQDSNFNLEVNETYRDLTAFGTSVLIQEPKVDFTEEWQGLQFTSIPLKESYFEPDAEGGARTVYRLLNWRASKFVDKFGYDKCTERIQKLYDSNTDEAVEVVFCVFPRDDKKGQKDQLLTPENRPYGWIYMERNGGGVLAEGGYYEMPAYVSRWLTTSQSMWGNSPAMVALADVITLNKLTELNLNAMEKVVDPTIMTKARNIIGQLRLGAGDINTVRDVTQTVPFESRARFDVTQGQINDLQIAINGYFFIDKLELRESPAMTATEVQVRYELMQRTMSAPMSRIKTDMLDPMISRTFNILMRAGQLPPMPESVKLTNPDFDIEYVGPMSRSQRFDQSASIERWIGQLTAMAQMGPDAEQVLLVPDWDMIAREAAKSLNLPTMFTRDKDDVAEDVAEKKKQQNDAQAAATNKDAAAAEASLASADMTGAAGDAGPTAEI